MLPASRTPEGEPNRCLVCGKDVVIEPSHPPGDAPCPHCGSLLWFSEVLDLSGNTAEDAQSLAWPPLRADWRMPECTKGRSARSVVAWRRQVLVAAAAGFLVGTAEVVASLIASNGIEDLSIFTRVCIPGVCCGISVLAALGLSLRDALLQRKRNGKTVNLLLRLYFIDGWLSLAVWIATPFALLFILLWLVSWSSRF
jgi:hypothetical protein